MLSVIISWLIIFFILTTFGNLFVWIYSTISKRHENNNAIDVFLIGLCFLCGLLSIVSIQFACNERILCVILLCSAIYWLFFKQQRLDCLKQVRAYYKKLSKIELVLIVISLLIFVLYSTWSIIRYDSAMYHFQQIRWNEEYPLIPGLANLEVRFGTNSNYFLVSSIFTFRFLFGEAIYTLHSLLAFLIMLWIIRKVFCSSFDIKNLLLLFVYVLFVYVNIPDLRGLSGDIIPNLVVFYIFSRLILDTSLLRKNFLFLLLLPITLVTFKLSIGLVLLIGIYPLVVLLREKQYKALIFICLSALFVIIPWLVRNVIISGYLIHPFYFVDFFSFDWKAPSEFLEREGNYIRSHAQGIFMKQFNAPEILQPLRFYIDRYIHYMVYVVLILSPIFICFSAYGGIKKKRKTKGQRLLYYIYAVLFLNIIFWLISAPDPRFINGCLFISAFFSIYIILPNRPLIYSKNKLSLFIVMFLALYLLFDNIKWVKTYSDGYSQTLRSLYMPQFNSDKIYTEFPVYTVYELDGGVVVYVTDDCFGKCFDVIPCVKEENEVEFNYADYKKIEARGNKISDGFRYRQNN